MFFVALHLGAGYHSPLRSKEYLELIQLACKEAAAILTVGGTACDAVESAIKFLENSPLTNAGFGSNLTEMGQVECDASIMSNYKTHDGDFNSFGGIGAVSGVQNPIQVANALRKSEQGGRKSLGRVHPICLVGEGATEWAAQQEIPIISPEKLISDAAQQQWEIYSQKIQSLSRKRPNKETEEDHDLWKRQKDEESVQDTVGAVCLDSQGHLAAGVSSGGVAFKPKGRVGAAGMFGCGCWVDDSKACSASGTGEQLMHSLFASSFCQQWDSEREESVDQFFEQFVKGQKRMGGVVGVHWDNTRKVVNMTWGHSTQSMAVGCFSSSDLQPFAHISRLEDTNKFKTSFMSTKLSST